MLLELYSDPDSQLYNEFADYSPFKLSYSVFRVLETLIKFILAWKNIVGEDIFVSRIAYCSHYSKIIFVTRQLFIGK